MKSEYNTIAILIAFTIAAVTAIAIVGLTHTRDITMDRVRVTVDCNDTYPIELVNARLNNDTGIIQGVDVKTGRYIVVYGNLLEIEQVKPETK